MSRLDGHKLRIIGYLLYLCQSAMIYLQDKRLTLVERQLEELEKKR
jgi:hypothetical protein